MNHQNRFNRELIKPNIENGYKTAYPLISNEPSLEEKCSKKIAEEPNSEIAANFLDSLDEESDQYTFQVIQEPKPSQGPHFTQTYDGSFEKCRETLLRANRRGCGVFFTVNETNGKGRKRADITRVRALFVDLDGSPLEPVFDGPLPPQITVESSPHRYHAYWIVEGIRLEEFELLQKQLAKQFDGDPSVCDLPRLMRLPGFIHRKGTPFQTRVLSHTCTRPYQREEFLAAFQQQPTRANPSAPIDRDASLLALLEERKMVKQPGLQPGHWEILCPWAEEHTSPGNAASYFEPSSRYPQGGFNCFHAHCQERGIHALHAFLGMAPPIEEEPLPLFRTPPAAAPFPIGALGPILRPAAEELFKTIQPPMAIIGQSMLACASLVTQAHANVLVPDGRTIALSLFFISIAESGDRKSATDDRVLKAVFSWQKHLKDEYDVEYRRYEAEKLRQAIDKKKERGKGVPEQIGNDCEPTPPIKPLLIIEEPTYEGLVKYLEHGQPSVGIFSDEGGRFLGGNAMSRENMLKTLAGFSSLWDAKKDKPITRVRSGDENLMLFGKRVSIHFMIQEEVYDNLVADSMADTQGFLPRCLISFPESLAGSRRYVSQNPSQMPGMQTFYHHCNRLLDCKYPSAAAPAPANQLEPRNIPLSNAAYELWIQFHDDLESKLGTDGKYFSIRRFGSKAAEHLLRISGVLTLFENPSVEEIPQEAIERAKTIIEYYLDENLRLEGHRTIDRRLIVAQRVLTWMQSKGKAEITLSELYQYGPSEVRSKEKAIEIMQILEAHGWVKRVLPSEVGTKPARNRWRCIGMNRNHSTGGKNV